jgi:hypothetical protein
MGATALDRFGEQNAGVRHTDGLIVNGSVQIAMAASQRQAVVR